ncbi:NAD(P)/FAD-dependent oxidoreductase [Acidicapsa dinghuensis]|uniref:NAD(P)/FAD-dependent oxidoreductase n=1 Tax=Acidicapsa dinghuensis TaxID=2218256 RepID=A0ABW1EGQ2_9BACT|nr:FAD-dependent oxidoreductase [Acidicapsa dinghuensis]
MTQPAIFDVAIAGGGIVGAACARALAHRGLSVALVERDVLGSGATSAGMGHVVVMDDSEAQFALTRYSQQLWRELAPKLPANCEYEECGTLWVAADEEEMAAVEQKHRWYGDRGVPTSTLTASELSAAEPNLRSGLAGALLVPQDSVVYPPVVALTLAREAEKLGAALYIGKQVHILSDGKLVLQDGSIIRAHTIINALGSESARITPGVPVRKRKGHLLITDRYPGFVRHQLVELGYLKSAHKSTGDSVAFNVQPRSTGQLLIGSSRQYGAETSEVNQPVVSAMLQRAIEYIPRVADLKAIRIWTGFRAATPDKLPLIGPYSDDQSLWLATGHEGLGITTSLATGELIADLITGRTTAIPCEPYLPARFANANQANHLSKP